jgi:hypothetical protein
MKTKERLASALPKCPTDIEVLLVRLGSAIDTIGAKRVVRDNLEAFFADLSNERIADLTTKQRLAASQELKPEQMTRPRHAAQARAEGRAKELQ